MATFSFRDRFLTPGVANTMTSPGAILLAGGAAAVVIATGLPMLLAPVAGVAAWGARVLASVPRNPEPPKIDVFTIPEPWRGAVVEAMRAQARYDKAINITDKGPIRERLRDIGERIRDGVTECYEIARRGHQLTEAHANIDAAHAAAELAKVDAQLASAPNENLQRTRAALQSQVDTANRLAEVLADVQSRLQLLDARLDEAVALAIELSVRVGDVDDLGGVGADVDHVVNEMESLRQALEETARTSRAVPGTA